jgi:hypothetical protein
MQEEPTLRRCPQPALKHGSTSKPRRAFKPSKIRDAAGGLFDPLQLKVPLLNLWAAALVLP